MKFDYEVISMWLVLSKLWSNLWRFFLRFWKKPSSLCKARLCRQVFSFNIKKGKKNSLKYSWRSQKIDEIFRDIDDRRVYLKYNVCRCIHVLKFTWNQIYENMKIALVDFTKKCCLLCYTELCGKTRNSLPRKLFCVKSI